MSKTVMALVAACAIGFPGAAAFAATTSTTNLKAPSVSTTGTVVAQSTENNGTNGGGTGYGAGHGQNKGQGAGRNNDNGRF
jgi:hypothetical protein